MSPAGVVASAASAVLALLAVAGLVVRDRLRPCFTFPLFLLSTALGHTLVLAWPSVFWTWEFWFQSSAAQALLFAGIAVEVALKTLRPPLYVGRKRIRFLLLVIGIGTVLAIGFYPHALRTAVDLTLLVESTSYGIAWMFGAFLLVVRWYHVPLDPLHRDIATGFTILNVLVFYREALFNFDSWFGLGTAAGRDLVTKTLYPVLLALWNVSAWRADEPTAFSPEVEKVLQPWRTRR